MKKKNRLSMIDWIFVVFLALVWMLLYPLWISLRLLAIFLGSGVVRMRAGNLEIPVVFYENPQTGRTVVFVATMHIAEAEYFAELQRLIDSLVGFTILCEGIVKLSPEEELSLSQEERDLLKDRFMSVQKTMNELGKFLGLQYQKNGLRYDASWINNDVRGYALVKAFSDHQSLFVKKKKEESVDSLFEDETIRPLGRYIADLLFGKVVFGKIFLEIFGCFSRRRRLEKRVIVEYRNDVAMNGVLEHLVTGDVALIWGAGHLKGLDKRLKRAGFREKRREWFVAYRSRNYGFVDCLQQVKKRRNELFVAQEKRKERNRRKKRRAGFWGRKSTSGAAMAVNS